MQINPFYYFGNSLKRNILLLKKNKLESSLNWHDKHAENKINDTIKALERTKNCKEIYSLNEEQINNVIRNINCMIKYSRNIILVWKKNENSSKQTLQRLAERNIKYDEYLKKTIELFESIQVKNKTSIEISFKNIVPYAITASLILGFTPVTYGQTSQQHQEIKVKNDTKSFHSYYPYSLSERGMDEYVNAEIKYFDTEIKPLLLKGAYDESSIKDIFKNIKERKIFLLNQPYYYNGQLQNGHAILGKLEIFETRQITKIPDSEGDYTIKIVYYFTNEKKQSTKNPTVGQIIYDRSHIPLEKPMMIGSGINLAYHAASTLIHEYEHVRQDKEGIKNELEREYLAFRREAIFLTKIREELSNLQKVCLIGIKEFFEQSEFEYRWHEKGIKLSQELINKYPKSNP